MPEDNDPLLNTARRKAPEEKLVSHNSMYNEAEIDARQRHKRNRQVPDSRSCNCCCLICADESSKVIVQWFGAMQGPPRGAGLHLICWPFQRASLVSLKVRQLDCVTRTKTLDNVSVSIATSVQYVVQSDRVHAYYFKLASPAAQIECFVDDSMRSIIPTMTLDETYASKSSIGDTLRVSIETDLDEFALDIVGVLVTCISVPPEIVAAMNEIAASRKLREAAFEHAEAEKIRIVKQAEADAEANHLRGIGIAKQRQAIAEGFQRGFDSLDAHHVRELLYTTLAQQYLDIVSGFSKAPAIVQPFKSTGRPALMEMTSTTDPVVQGTASLSCPHSRRPQRGSYALPSRGSESQAEGAAAASKSDDDPLGLSWLYSEGAERRWANASSPPPRNPWETASLLQDNQGISLDAVKPLFSSLTGLPPPQPPPRGVGVLPRLAYGSVEGASPGTGSKPAGHSKGQGTSSASSKAFPDELGLSYLYQEGLEREWAGLKGIAGYDEVQETLLRPLLGPSPLLRDRDDHDFDYLLEGRSSQKTPEGLLSKVKGQLVGKKASASGNVAPDLVGDHFGAQLGMQRVATRRHSMLKDEERGSRQDTDEEEGAVPISFHNKKYLKSELEMRLLDTPPEAMRSPK